MTEHEKVIKEYTRYQGPVFDVVTRTISTDHGTITRDVCVHHGDSVATALFIQGDLLLISKEYRVGDQGESWGLPAGMQEPGETPIQTAFRELKEELGIDGIEPEDVEDIGYISSSAGFVQEKVHVVCIDLGYKNYGTTERKWDSDEFINSYQFINYRDAIDWMKESQENSDESPKIMDSRFYVAAAHQLNKDLNDTEDELDMAYEDEMRECENGEDY